VLRARWRRPPANAARASGNREADRSLPTPDNTGLQSCLLASGNSSPGDPTASSYFERVILENTRCASRLRKKPWPLRELLQRNPETRDSHINGPPLQTLPFGRTCPSPGRSPGRVRETLPHAGKYQA